MLELKNISFTVSDNKEIIKNINLKINDNALTVITGPNGGGKSTLAKIIMGIEMPTTGSIILDGKDITNMNITERAANGVGYAFQNPVRFKGLCVRDLLDLATGKKLTTGQACAFLAEVGLCAKDYIDREINSSLSGGELKRIEIAMLIARMAKLSVFDEPEAGIDLWSFHNLIKVFKKIKEKTKGSIIIISHQERIMEIADNIIVIADGEVTGNDTREKILPHLLNTSDNCLFYKKER